MQLVDTNVWLALTFESHAHHPSAKSWIDSTPPQSCCFCRVTQMGFLRLATNRRIFPADAVPMDQAWELYGKMLTDLHIVYAEEVEQIQHERLDRCLPGRLRHHCRY